MNGTDEEALSMLAQHLESISSIFSRLVSPDDTHTALRLLHECVCRVNDTIQQQRIAATVAHDDITVCLLH